MLGTNHVYYFQHVLDSLSEHHVIGFTITAITFGKGAICQISRTRRSIIYLAYDLVRVCQYLRHGWLIS